MRMVIVLNGHLYLCSFLHLFFTLVFLYLSLRFCHAMKTAKKLCEYRKKDRKTKNIICKMNMVYNVYFGLPQNTGGNVFVYVIAVNNYDLELVLQYYGDYFLFF